MALKKQTTPVSSQVSVDFPDLPRFPNMKIPEDNAAMQDHQSKMDAWYRGLRQVILDKLNSVKKG